MASKPRPRKRSDGSIAWVLPFRLTPGGKPTSETFETAEDAVAFGKLVDRVGGLAAREARNASTGAGLDVPTLTTFVDQHLDRLGSSATPGTVEDYRRMARRTFLQRLGDLPVDAITEDAVVEWVGWQRQQETARSIAARKRARKAGEAEPAPDLYSSKSIANAQRFLSTVLETAVRRYGMTFNPAKGVKLPSDDAGEEMVFLTPNEYTALHAAVDPWYQPLVATLYATGMRWGEATALLVRDLDLNSDTPRIRVSHAWKKGAAGVYDGSPKSKRSRRDITLGPNLVTLLREQVAGKKPGDLVFTSRYGKRVRSQNFHPRVWHPAVAASGIGKRPRVHDLRHTHASDLLARGESVLSVQRRLGHESAKTTLDVYGHVAPSAGIVGLLAVDANLSGAVPQLEPGPGLTPEAIRQYRYADEDDE